MDADFGGVVEWSTFEDDGLAPTVSVKRSLRRSRDI